MWVSLDRWIDITVCIPRADAHAHSDHHVYTNRHGNANANASTPDGNVTEQSFLDGSANDTSPTDGGADHCDPANSTNRRANDASPADSSPTNSGATNLNPSNACPTNVNGYPSRDRVSNSGKPTALSTFSEGLGLFHFVSRQDWSRRDHRQGGDSQTNSTG